MTELHLLVVDWDYFFPNPVDGGDYEVRDVVLYDWKHQESPMFIDTLWMTRAEGFLSNGLELPRCKDYENFWSRFRLVPNAPLTVADSNVHAGLMKPATDTGWHAWDSVWLFDAHHDCGYKGDFEVWEERGTITCEDWMLAHHINDTELHVRYPTWKIHAMTCEPEPLIPVDRSIDDGSVPPVEFDAVAVCRSGAWVPSWCDDQFAEFVAAFPGGPVSTIPDDMDRTFDMDAVNELMAMKKQLLAIRKARS